MRRMQSLLEELDIIEYYQHQGKAYHLAEIAENFTLSIIIIN